MSGTKSENPDRSVRGDFERAASKARSSRQGGRKPTPRITLRLSKEENELLMDRAGDLSISAYVRECLFEKDGSRRKRRSYRPVADQEALAQVLSKLGQSRMANNLNQIAYHANSGSLIVDETTIDDINEAAATIAWLRVTLIEALGLNDKKQDKRGS